MLRKRTLALAAICLAIFFWPLLAGAQEDGGGWLPPCDEPPLPLFGIEGYDGVAITYSAYLMNPCTEPGQVVSLPNVGAGFLVFPSGRWFYYLQSSITFFDRVNLSYAFNTIDVESLRDDINAAIDTDIGTDTSRMNNFNARLNLIKENQFGLPWLPEVTFGAHFKHNMDQSDIDDNLSGTLTDIGVEDNTGWDFTLYFSKLLTFLPRPLLVDFGIRNSEAAHIGLLGFTGDREFTVEGNLVLFATDRLLLAAEYRQQPEWNYDTIPGLVEQQDDWWSVAVAFLFSNHFSASAGIFNLGEVLNEYNNGGFALKAKYQF